MARNITFGPHGDMEESDDIATPEVAAEAPAAPVVPAAPQSFKQAFAAARAAGDKAFEWNGKKFTTDLAPAKPAVSARGTSEDAIQRRPQPKVDTPPASMSRAGILNRMREADKGIKGVRDFRPPRDTPQPSELMTRRGKDVPESMGMANEYAKGGAVRGDGVAAKGRTRGTMR